MKSFSLLKSIFGGKSLPDEEQRALFEELLFLTLARASRTDLDTAEVEVDIICKILDDHGVKVTPQEVRLASMSELYEDAPLEKYLAKGGQQLNISHRQNIISGLLSVVKGDGVVGSAEAEFFNLVAEALDLSPIHLVGVTVDG
jgi:uncharacterized tellurite resistance protein B-like protein